MFGRDSKGRYVKGHQHSPEILKKLSLANMGKIHLQSWNAGLTKETDERVAKMASKKRGVKTAPRLHRRGIRVSQNTEFKKGLVPKGGFSTRFKKGANHPLWKNGVTSENEKIRKSGEYKNWRIAVYRRDGFCCQICKKHCDKKNIVAHHKNSFSLYPQSRFVVEEGITLCRRCHLNLHKQQDDNYAFGGTKASSHVAISS